MTGSFVEAVRARKVKTPVQRGFARADWDLALATSATPGIEDVRLHESGLWFDGKLADVRLEAEGTPLPRLGRLTARHAALAFLNHAAYEVESEIGFLSESGDPAGGDRDVPISPLTAVPQARAIDDLVEAGRHLLAAPLGEAGRAASSSSPRRSEVQCLRDRLRIACIYDSLEKAWGDCLWAGSYIERRPDVDVLRPHDDARYLSERATELREDQLEVAFGGRAVSGWTMLDESGRMEILRRPWVSGLRVRGGVAYLNREPSRPVTKYPPMEFIATLLAMEIHLETMLDEPIPSLRGVTGRQLIDAWEFLSSIGYAAKGLVSVGARFTAARAADELAPLFRRVDLVDGVRAAMSSTPEQAASVISDLTYGGTPRDDVWRKPLIPIREGHVGLVLPAILTPNRLWKLEKTWREGGVDVEKRGPAFEAYVRRSVGRECQLPDAGVHATPFELGPPEGREEIDLMVRVGRTLAVGEVKCTIRPTSAWDRHNIDRTLKNASDQARRKASFVATNLAEALVRCGWGGMPIDSVIPFVLTNQPCMAGLSSTEVPVVDRLILERYLCEGSLPVGVVASREGIHSARTIRFYESQAKAGSRLANYLKSPPQLEIFRKMMLMRERPLQLAGGGRPALVAVSWAAVAIDDGPA